MESRIERLNIPQGMRIRAALWVTDLHGPKRNARLEARLKRWLARDGRHAAAFEWATEAWQRSGNPTAGVPPGLGAMTPRSRTRYVAPVLAAAAVACALAVAWYFVLRASAYGTGRAEQRTVALDDGTEVSLNANTRMAVRYDEHVRKVSLAAGEAFFNVTKQPGRPFVVGVGDRKIVALGTAFEVRRERSVRTGFTVTLIEGRVAVEARSAPDVLPTENTAGVKILSPGQRLRFESESQQTVDTPSIEQVTAWRRGQLIFEDASLAEAASEFNRYGAKTLIVDGAAVSSLRVGGVFKISDPASFARAMARAHQLRVIERGDAIVLTDDTEKSRQ